MVWSDESDYESENSYTDGYELEDYDPDRIEERPTSVPTLQKIATVKVAIALWNRATVVIPGFIVDGKKWQNSLLYEVFKWIDTLPVPKLLADYIKQHFGRVKNNVYNWTYHLSQALFFESSELRLKPFQLVDCIIWYPNERINFVETARKLLKSDELSNLHKFHLASTYCLQEEIEKIWATMTELERDDVFGPAISTTPINRHRPICYYSAAFCQSEFRTKNPLREVPRCVVNWSAIKYFFDRLSTEQQVAEASYLIRKFGLRFQHLVLMKLNESQRVSVLEENAIFIICNYAQSEDGEEYAISTWYEFRDFITQDEFVNLFSQLLSVETKDSILTEIWNTAPDGLKHYILNYGNYYFIGKVLRWLTWYKYKESGLIFVSSVLSYSYRACVDFDIKRKITKKPCFIVCCLRLCSSCFTSMKSLDRLLNLCLLDAAESTEYKQFLLRSPDFNIECQTLITIGNFPKLVKLLDSGFSITVTDPSSRQFLREMVSRNMGLLNEWCLECYSTGNLKDMNDILAPLRSSYPEIVSEYKKKLLMLSDEGWRMCVSHFGSKNCILPRIIADGVPADLAAEFKRKIISSPEAIDKLKSMMVKKRSLNFAKKLVDWYLESKTARKKFRKQLGMV